MADNLVEEPKNRPKEMHLRPMIYGKLSQAITLIIVFAIFLGATGFVGYRWFRPKPSNLEIVANLAPPGPIFKSLTGRVFCDGKPMENSQVSAVLIDTLGNKKSSRLVMTDKEGGFAFDSLAMSWEWPAFKEVIIYAQKDTVNADGQRDTKKGQVFLKITGRGSIKIIQLDAWTVAYLPVIFIISLIVPFLPLNPRWKYGISIGSAIIFTIAMIAFISVALYNINTNYSSDSKDILSLGFASLFQGKYVPGTSSEWIFSFTSSDIVSNSNTTGEQVMKGFGIPLWVLLMAVIGAGLLTVSIVVSEIKDHPNFYLLEDATANKVSIEKDSPEGKEIMHFGNHLERIIRHQFNILFSPIGAIFVYQLLVMADAAVNSVTVALAAFGAGASLNLIVDKAISYAENAIKIKK